MSTQVQESQAQDLVLRSILRDLIAKEPEWEKYPDLVLHPVQPDELQSEYPEARGEIVTRCCEMLSIGVNRGSLYMMRRMIGCSHSMAEIIALQSYPGLATDATFFEGQKPLYDQFESQKNLNRYLKQAKKHGFTPSINSTYISSIARFPGDPEAFVDRTQGRGYIRRLMEKRGWACEGAVNVEAREPDTDPLADENCVRLAPDIVKRHEKQAMRNDPALAAKPANHKDRKKIRAAIVERHGA